MVMMINHMLTLCIFVLTISLLYLSNTLKFMSQLYIGKIHENIVNQKINNVHEILHKTLLYVAWLSSDGTREPRHHVRVSMGA